MNPDLLCPAGDALSPCGTLCSQIVPHTLMAFSGLGEDRVIHKIFLQTCIFITHSECNGLCDCICFLTNSLCAVVLAV